jgi:hypothetical protein
LNVNARQQRSQDDRILNSVQTEHTETISAYVELFAFKSVLLVYFKVSGHKVTRFPAA